MDTFDQKRRAFGAEAAEAYRRFAEQGLFEPQTDLYVYQTAVRHAPELMLVGINPGGNGHKGICDTEGTVGGTYNAYVDCRDEHPWFTRLYNLFDTPCLRPLLERCVGTNEYFINTGSANGLPHAIELRRMATTLVRKLADEVIEPERIITLGRDVFASLCNTPSPAPVRFGEVLFRYGYRRRPDSRMIPVGYLCNPSPRNARYFAGGKTADWQRALEWFLTELH
ncbi:hypothetical protein [uncultured Alistipes sp.]|uniref:hypothetical protein n=1 Tax=uncultured Alistipes sp. TaxID=538949 RepID=UPI0026366E24|nr:hypothetical protein [uncultured Alistipes sp.]